MAHYPKLTKLTNQIITISGGTGILTGGTYPNFTITNTSPDRIVSISGGTNLSITGTYPNFGVNFTGSTGGYTYEIGQYVSSKGGVIFHRYLDGGNENYLVVDTTDLSVSAQWASVNVNIPNVESVWNGLTNTSNLILAGAGSGITSGTAAVLCNNSTNNGQTDWYLPAAYEIATIWNNKFSVAIGLEQAGGQNLLFGQNYATSTEIDANSSYLFNTVYGTNFSDASMGGKTTTRYVRAVRKFSL